MNIQQLEYVVALDTHRHFVTAATHCHVTQPTLSMQVQNLEKELDVLLFDRKRSPLEPTPAGRKVIAQARQVLREIQVLRDSVKEEKARLTGEFRLGIIPTLAQYLVPLFLVDFVHKHPQTNLLIEELPTDQIVDRLKQSRLDLGILVTPLEDDAIREVPVFNEPFLAYVSRGHALFGKPEVRAEELEEADVWLLNQGHCFRSQVLHLCNGQEASCSRRGFAYESGSIETLKRMVDRHSGYTLVPELSVLDEIGTNPVVKRFAAPEPVREVSLVAHRSFPKEALLQALRAEILASIPERMRINGGQRRIRWRPGNS
ncbi:MAG: Hydrogen peroxide-inducible genes activator _ OxyR [uncultured Cytophagales bacterium]|uniref:Hydrogen peroxide-inducible genes activator > OxyR n=1 Tax=uncultured Cytophagales bacterium TaxID=158755 RepID=A0A6J4JNY2_9SPHI|nr:MAG: Hydrogen peroxide-inducible genes activator > OxyR [uncultured Cytophagales bacterium]